MSIQVEFLREAMLEVQEAFVWYEEQRYGLGSEFLMAMAASLELIRRNPNAAPLVGMRTRKVLLRRFPYVVLYSVESKTTILVTSVSDGRRHPRNWTDRVRETAFQYGT